MYKAGVTIANRIRTTIAIGDSLLANPQCLQIGSWENYSYICKGISGETSTQIVARFRTDVLNYLPLTDVIIAAGTNDLAASITEATFLANLTTMLSTCESYNLRTRVVLMLCRDGQSNANMQTLDTWNADLIALARTYGAIPVNARPYIGQFRVGGDAGNLWDYKTDYSDDGTHPNQLGRYYFGQAVHEAT